MAAIAQIDFAHGLPVPTIDLTDLLSGSSREPPGRPARRVSMDRIKLIVGGGINLAGLAALIGHFSG
ncbi:MAG: hypothetical protein KDF67_11955, partial [Ottowia sp.]|nr:hypothetical protein [Ottowia sp.]